MNFAESILKKELSSEEKEYGKIVNNAGFVYVGVQNNLITNKPEFILFNSLDPNFGTTMSVKINELSPENLKKEEMRMRMIYKNSNKIK
jgi:hypothetical protein